MHEGRSNEIAEPQVDLSDFDTSILAEGVTLDQLQDAVATIVAEHRPGLAALVAELPSIEEVKDTSDRHEATLEDYRDKAIALNSALISAEEAVCAKAIEVALGGRDESEKMAVVRGINGYFRPADRSSNSGFNRIFEHERGAVGAIFDAIREKLPDGVSQRPSVPNYKSKVDKRRDELHQESRGRYNQLPEEEDS